MVNALIRAGIRQNKGTLAGVFVAVLTATMLATGLGVLIESGSRGGVDPERYTAADDYRVVGVAAAASENQPARAEHVFLTDVAASALAPRGAAANVVGVFAREGVSPDDLVGVFPGFLLAVAMRVGFAQAGVIPQDFALTVGPIPALIAVVVMVAARRPARINPIEALQEASTTPSRVGRGRTITGVLLGAGGLLASAIPLFVPGTIAVAGPAAAALFLIGAVGLLGPRLVRAAITVE